MSPWLLRFVMTALGGYIVLCGLVMLLEPALIFLPSPYDGGPEWRLPERDPTVEDVWIETEDGRRIHGWWVSPPGGAPAEHTILFLHGNAGNLAGRGWWAQRLAGLPAQVLLIDYAGYGRSQGSPTEATVFADVRAAHRYLLEERLVPPRSLVVYGKSLGGGPACYLATERPVGGLILDSAFTSVPDMGARQFPFLPVRLLSRHRFDNLSRIPGLKVPLLHYHSRHDEIVPFAMAPILHGAAPDPKTFHAYEGPGHNELIAEKSEDILARIRAFLDSLPGEAP
jgi:pimeloyl-ACP methyl ester carboxylesterase